MPPFSIGISRASPVRLSVTVMDSVTVPRFILGGASIVCQLAGKPTNYELPNGDTLFPDGDTMTK